MDESSEKSEEYEKVERFIETHCIKGHMKLVLPCFTDACMEEHFSHGPMLFAVKGERVIEMVDLPMNLMDDIDKRTEFIVWLFRKYAHCIGLGDRIEIKLK